MLKIKNFEKKYINHVFDAFSNSIASFLTNPYRRIPIKLTHLEIELFQEKKTYMIILEKKFVGFFSTNATVISNLFIFPEYRKLSISKFTLNYAILNLDIKIALIHEHQREHEKLFTDLGFQKQENNSLELIFEAKKETFNFFKIP